MVIQPFNTAVQFGPQGSIPVVYCNGVQVATSQWDITVLFFHSSPLPANVEEGGDLSQGNFERRVVQAVVMSPQHAKALATVLTHNIEVWEQNNGEIAVPPEVLAGLTGAISADQAGQSSPSPESEGTTEE